MCFAPGDWLFSILCSLYNFSYNRKPNRNPTLANASTSRYHVKRRPRNEVHGTPSGWKTVSDLGDNEVRFLRFFQKPNKKPDSHEKNALQRYSRYDKLYTRKSTINSEIYGNFTKTILTHREEIHDTKHFSLLFLSLQEIITHNFSSLYSCVLRLNTGFSFVFISKMLERFFRRVKNPTKTQHKFSVFVRISPFFRKPYACLFEPLTGA